MKKKVRRKSENNIRSNQSGSITIFLTLIIMSVILLTGSMIDVSRIMVADNKMDSAIRAATKSLMAEYDTDLYGSYGMFGLNLEENSETFTNYMQQNLELSTTPFMEYELVERSTEVAALEGYDLSNNECIQDQINSYMSLKGPVNFGYRTATRAMETIKVLVDTTNTKDKGDKKKLEEIDEIEIKSTNRSDKMENVKEELTEIKGEVEAELNDSNGATNEALENLRDNEQLGLGEVLANASPNDNTDLKTVKGLIEELELIAAEMEEKKADLETELAKDKESRNEQKIERLREELIELEEEFKQKKEELVELKNELVSNASNYEDAEYTSIEELYDSLEQLNTKIEGLHSAVSGENSAIDASNTGELFNSFKLARTAFNDLFAATKEQDVMNSLSDKFLAIEYVLDRFSYATSSVERELSVFKTGEVEYILIGSNIESINLMGVVAKIFLVCFVVDLLDLFLLGLPLWPVAILGSLPYAVYSVQQLLEGEKFVPFNLFLEKKLRLGKEVVENVIKELIGMTYFDFLYLQLCTQDIDVMLPRIGELLRANVNKSYYEENDTLNGAPSLSQYATGIKTKASCKVNLLFLPIFPLEAMNLKGFEGSQYQLNKNYEFAYQDISNEE